MTLHFTGEPSETDATLTYDKYNNHLSTNISPTYILKVNEWTNIGADIG